jgi:DNA-damage-inducible protein D
MKKNNNIEKMLKTFEDYVHHVEGMEVWFARELQGLLEYSEWRNFYSVIEKAKEACKNSNCNTKDHFVDVNKMVELGSGAKKEIDDIMLNRYACYLIAQNGDPKKEVIAFAQTYFAFQTRKQELIEKRLKERERLEARQKLGETEKFLSAVIYEKGIDEKGFGRIRSKGDKALFGYSTSEMKDKLGMPQKKALADFLPTITIKAKDFANEITAFNVKQHNLNNENKITDEHVKNNKDVRKVLTDRDIYPENLSPEEDIKKVERRLLSETKKLSKNV